MPYSDPNKRREANRKYSAAYRERHPDRLAKARRRYRDNNPEPQREANRRYRKANRVKRAAREAVARALERGEITKEPCLFCGDPTVEGHHHDYSRPLDITWLCRGHHWLAHGHGGKV